MKISLVSLIVLSLLNNPIHVLGRQNDEVIPYILDLVARCDEKMYDDPAVSLELSEEAYRLAKELGNDSLIAVILNRYGSAYLSLGNVIDALEKIQESLQIAESKNFGEILAKNYGNLGNIYSTAGLDLDAIAYYKRELTIQQELNDLFRIFVVNNNIGKAFLDVGYYDSSHYYLAKAGENLQDDFVHLHSIYYINLAETYFGEENYPKADSLLQITFKNATEYKSRRGLIRAHRLQAALHKEQGKYKMALEHAKTAVEMADQSKIKELIYLSHQTLSACYAGLGDFEKAYFHDQIYESYRDSVQSSASVNELELLSYYQRLFRLRVLQLKNNTNEALAEQRKFIIYSLVGVLFITLFMISIIVSRGRKIRSQAKKLESLNAFKNKIFAIISHDLKSPIQAVASAVEMFQEKIVSREEIEAHLPEMREKSTRLLDLLNNIFQWAEGQMGDEVLKKERFRFIDIYHDLEEELSDQLRNKEITLEYEGEPDFELFSNPGIIRIVLRNLIVNAIKFSFKKSNVLVRSVEGHSIKIVEVQDQGVGIHADMREGLFSMGTGSSVGTEGEKGNGLGLALCSDFIRNMDATIEVESEIGTGSTFRIYFTHQDEQQ